MLSNPGLTHFNKPEGVNQKVRSRGKLLMLTIGQRLWIIHRGLNFKLGASFLAPGMTLASARAGRAERLEPYRCGSILEDAKWLLRYVLPYGVLGERRQQRLAPLEDIIGRPVVITANVFRIFLFSRGIDEGSLGGIVSEPLSKASAETWQIIS
jgi:hypothetical protein